MSAFDDWHNDTYGSDAPQYEMQRMPFEAGHNKGRASMKADILRLFSTDLLSRDSSLQKLASTIAEME